MHVPAYCTLVYETMSTIEVANWEKLWNVGFKIWLSPFWGWGECLGMGVESRHTLPPPL